VPDVGKIDLVGLQDEKVWIELSNTRLATLGVSMQQVQQALADQNAVTGTSFFETATDRVQLRVTGQFNDIEAIRQFPIRAGDRTVHLGDIAEVSVASPIRRRRRCASWARRPSAWRWR
jgi:multidrug efflux pump